MPYFHVVFTLPSTIGDIAYQNKAVIYDLLIKASADTMLTIAADPQHLGARITAVLHTWGSAMTHHPHVHMIVPGGGIALDGSRWIAKRPDFLLPVRVLSKLFRRLMTEKLIAAHAAGQLTFYGAHAALANAKAFSAYLAPLKRTRRFVYAKRPFAGPKAVLAHLSRYTHRVAISNRRLVAVDDKAVTFKVKDYRIKGPGGYKTMTLDAHEFIRRFLIHALPKGFHRIRHCGLLARSFEGKVRRLASAGEIFCHRSAVPRAQGGGDWTHHGAAPRATGEGIKLLDAVGRVLAVQIRHRCGIAHHHAHASAHHTSHAAPAAHHPAASETRAAPAVTGDAGRCAARRGTENTFTDGGELPILYGIGLQRLIAIVTRKLFDLRISDRGSWSRHDVRFARAALKCAQLQADVGDLLVGKLRV